MSRKKSSRKQGSAPRAQPKLSKHELEKVEKRVRKKTGKKPGNKQLEGIEKLQGVSSKTIKDPRLGNKTPIVLDPKVSTVKKINKQPATNIKTDVLGQNSILLSDKENEIEAIENDEKLQLINVKQESDFALTTEEVDYYNAQMERYQKLQTDIGIDDTEEIVASNSEDDLWDKLDNSNFNEY